MRLLIFQLIFAIWGFKGIFNFRAAAGLYLFVEIFRPLAFSFAEGAFPASMLAMGVLAISYIIGIATGSIKFRANYLFFTTIPFLIWIFYCTQVSAFPATALIGLKTSFLYIIPILLISTGINTRKDINYLILVAAVSLGIWASRFGLDSLFNGVNKYMEIPGSQIGDNNNLAAAIDAAIPLLFFTASFYSGKLAGFWRKIFMAMFFLSIVAVIFSDSRGGALGLLAIVIVYVCIFAKKKLRAIALAVLLAIVVAAVLPQSFYDRMSTLKHVGTKQAESSASERMLLLTSTFAAAKDHSLFGVGPYCWLNIAKDYTGLNRAMQPHNVWLKAWVELGLVGLFLFILIWLGVIVDLIMVYRSSRATGNLWVANVTLCLVLSLFSFLITYTFLNYWDGEYLWFILAFGSITCSLYRRGELEDNPDDDEDTTETIPATV